MNLGKNIQDLETLLEGSRNIEIEDCDSADFTSWKNQVIRVLTKIFGEKSIELEQFKSLDFFFNTPVRFLDVDYSAENLKRFRNDFEVATKALQAYLSELKNEEKDNQIIQPSSSTTNSTINKVFISHSSTDKELVEELVDLLDNLGLSHNHIFCSSIQEYGIELGENFLERLKNELDSNVLVLFILSDNFYKSPVCLCEMGATWISTKAHIPIVIPPLDFKDIKGVIPLTQGFIISDRAGLNQFKDKVQQLFL
jgi:hypothetical protein